MRVLRVVLLGVSVAVTSLTRMAAAQQQEIEELVQAVVGAVPYFLFEDDSGSERFRHADCVGFGAPGTAPTHVTHTVETGPLFVPSGEPVVFSLDPISLIGESGICPTSIEGPLLSQGFTGRYRETVRCGGGTGNPGTVVFVYTQDYLAAYPSHYDFVEGSGCTAPFGNYGFEIEYEILPLPIENTPIEIPPFGGILQTVSQVQGCGGYGDPGCPPDY